MNKHDIFADKPTKELEFADIEQHFEISREDKVLYNKVRTAAKNTFEFLNSPMYGKIENDSKMIPTKGRIWMSIHLLLIDASGKDLPTNPWVPEKELILDIDSRLNRLYWYVSHRKKIPAVNVRNDLLTLLRYRDYLLGIVDGFFLLPKTAKDFISDLQNKNVISKNLNDDMISLARRIDNGLNKLGFAEDIIANLSNEFPLNLEEATAKVRINRRKDKVRSILIEFVKAVKEDKPISEELVELITSFTFK